MSKRAEKVFTLEVEALLHMLKKTIHPEDRAYPEDETPGVLVTIGAEHIETGAIAWNYQTGDNSFTGGAYGYHCWSVVSLYPKSNCKELAKDVLDQFLLNK